MRRSYWSIALVLGLAACGGTPPFGGTTTEADGDATERAVPDVLAGDVQSFTYDPVAETLTVQGVPFDDGPASGEYRRRELLDRNGYEAYTAQDGSLDRHTTAYVKRINNTQAAVVVTGVQFEESFGGALYSTGAYSAPSDTIGEGGIVTYAGKYIGMLNMPGSGEDLTAVQPGTSDSVRSAQAAEVTGDVLITGDFGQASVDGVIHNRVIPDYDTTLTYDPNSATPYNHGNVALAATGIEADGTFFGEAKMDNVVKGEYGGLFGGTGATEVAGAVHLEDHLTEVDNEVEYGVFVLAQCGQPDEDPVCAQPVE